MENQLLSIIIITCNRKNELIKTINSCEKYCGMPYEIIIIDNGSTDGTRDYLIDLCKHNNNIKCSLENNNLGVSGGRNRGYSLAKSEILFFIDDDAFFEEDSKMLIDAYRFMVENSTVGALAFNIYDLKQQRLLIDEYSKNRDSEVISYIGAAHMLRKLEKFEGYLYPEYLKYGAEERYAAVRYAELGYHIEIFSGVKILHNPSIHTRTSATEIHRNVKINQYVIKKLSYPKIIRSICFPVFLIRLIKLEKFNLKQVGTDLKIMGKRYAENRSYYYTVKLKTIKKLCNNFGIKNII